MSDFQAAQRFDVQATASNHFSWMRTRQAVERTYLAWIRTGVSLIGFGFTIVQFFEKMQGMTARGGRTMAEQMPRNLGLALIAAGILALTISSFQYRGQLRYLWSEQFRSIAGISEKPHRTPAFISAMVLLLIGVAAFVSVFFRFL